VAALTLAGSLLLAAPTFAQNRSANSEPPSLPNAVLAASELSEQQQQQVADFVEQGLGKLTSDRAGRIIAGRRQLLQPYNAGGVTSDAFESVYEPRLIEGLSQAMQQGGPMVRLNAMIVAARTQRPAVLSLARDALADKDPGVRYWAAQAIRNAARRSEDGLAEDQRQSVVQALAKLATGEADAHVVKPALLALAAIAGEQANDQLVAALNQRLQVHAGDPQQTYLPEQDALQTLYRNLAQAAANGQSDPAQIRELARVVFRYRALVEQQLSNHDFDEATVDRRERLVDFSQQVLAWTANQLDVDGVPRSTDQWRQQLTQSPYNLGEDALAVPG
jgi:hypothetical protein